MPILPPPALKNPRFEIRNPRLPLLLALLLTLTGCYERTEKITLNPDGSGKSQVDFLLEPDPEKPELAFLSRSEQARLRAKDIIAAARGADVWKDISFAPAPNGRTRFKATVYFKHIEKYNLDHFTLLRLAWTGNPKTGMTLLATRQGAEPDDRPAPDPQPSTQEITDRIKALRDEWQDHRQLLDTLRRLKLDLTFTLPGKVDDASNFQKTPDGVRFYIDGQKMIGDIDSVMKSDAALTAQIKAGDVIDDASEKTTNQIVLGQSAPARVHVAGDLKPLFNYNAESAAARKDQQPMFRRLGLSDDPPPTLDPSTPLTPVPVP